MRPRGVSTAALEAIPAVTVVVFAVWTLGYQLVLATRWPAWVSIAVFPVGLAIAAAVYFAAKHKPLDAPPDDARLRPGVMVALMALALFCAYVSLIVSRPDTDDIGFFHRPMVQASQLDEPFILGDTTLNYPGLPGPTSMHLMASYEMAVAFAARVLHLDSLCLYQNGACAFVSFLLPLVYFLLFRRLGLTQFQSLPAVVAVVWFLWFDGNLHASLGNLAFVRLWQGKWIMLAVLCPFAALVTDSLCLHPSRRSWLLLFCCGVSALGLSGTALVVFPVFVFVVSAAVVTNEALAKRVSPVNAVKRLVLVNVATMYCVLLGSLVQIGVIPILRDMATPAALGHSVSWSWWQNLSVTLGAPKNVAWYAALLVLGPVLSPSSRAAKVVALWALFAVLICFTPMTGPFWLKILLAVYYRLLFVLPIPVCAGLALAGIATMWKSPWRAPSLWLRTALLILLVVLFSRHFEQAAFSRSNRAFRKPPCGYRFEWQALRFSRRVAPLLDGKSVLAPDEIIAVLPLLNPSLRLEAHRWWVTIGYFHDAGQTAEGVRRTKAQLIVMPNRYGEPMFDTDLSGTEYEGLDFDPAEAFKVSVRNGLDAVIARNNLIPGIRELLADTQGEWEIAWSDPAFTLLLKK